jgi:toxoflavin synthase
MSSQFDALGDAYEQSVRIPYREYSEHYSMREAVGDVTGLTVLDLGCGTGVYTRRFAQWGAARVVGVDVSDGMLATARARAQERPTPNVEYLRRDVTHPAPHGDPALDGQFELVSSVYVLCYAATPEELLGLFTTARRALSATGTRFVATTLNPDYSREPRHYSPYEISLTPTAEGEGAPITLDVRSPGGRIHAGLFWWSYEMNENCAVKAGFANVTWTSPTISAEGLAQFGSHFWDAYLNPPPTLILTATV